MVYLDTDAYGIVTLKRDDGRKMSIVDVMPLELVMADAVVCKSWEAFTGLVSLTSFRYDLSQWVFGVGEGDRCTEQYDLYGSARNRYIRRCLAIEQERILNEQDCDAPKQRTKTVAMLCHLDGLTGIELESATCALTASLPASVGVLGVHLEGPESAITLDLEEEVRQVTRLMPHLAAEVRERIAEQSLEECVLANLLHLDELQGYECLPVLDAVIYKRQSLQTKSRRQ